MLIEFWIINNRVESFIIMCRMVESGRFRRSFYYIFMYSAKDSIDIYINLAISSLYKWFNQNRQNVSEALSDKFWVKFIRVELYDP